MVTSTRTHARGRLNSLNGLPVYSSSSSAVQEKLALRPTPWWFTLSLPIPGFPSRRLRLVTPYPFRLHEFTISRFGRKRGPLFLCISIVALIFTTFSLAQRFGSQDKQWPTFTRDPPTLVYKREDLQRIWLWEVSSGHYPSRRKSRVSCHYLCLALRIGHQYQNRYIFGPPLITLLYPPRDNTSLTRGQTRMRQLHAVQGQIVFIWISRAILQMLHTLLDQFPAASLISTL